jgi:hypothetical protein
MRSYIVHACDLYLFRIPAAFFYTVGEDDIRAFPFFRYQGCRHGAFADGPLERGCRFYQGKFLIINCFYMIKV